jgi:hypothetical protein
VFHMEFSGRVDRLRPPRSYGKPSPAAKRGEWDGSLAHRRWVLEYGSDEAPWWLAMLLARTDDVSREPAGTQGKGGGQLSEMSRWAAAEPHLVEYLQQPCPWSVLSCNL